MGQLEGLVTLECELPGEASATKFSLPSWAAKAVDITKDKAYKNKNLATKGLPTQCWKD